jgi:hypothetical protein
MLPDCPVPVAEPPSTPMTAHRLAVIAVAMNGGVAEPLEPVRADRTAAGQPVKSGR